MVENKRAPSRAFSQRAWVSLFEEARRVNEVAEIEFRTFGGARHAFLSDGLRLWKVIFTAQSYEMDAKKTADHFELPVWKVQVAFYYYEAFPKEIDECVSED